MTETERKHKRLNITPLWVIGLFVSLTETVLGVGVLQTSGSIQIALTAFVLVFPLLIAGMFFAILWWRPYVLYPPTEYGLETDVASYVRAMQQRPIDENTLYSSIQETIRATMTSGDVVGELSRVLPSRTLESKQAQVVDVLSLAADKAVEQIRESNFLAIDSRPLLGEEQGKVWQVAYENFSSVSELLDDVWSWLYRHTERMPAYEYGISWALRDSETGQVFKDAGEMWATNQFAKKLGRRVDLTAARTWAGTIPDTRTLREIGITPGMSLEVVRL
jgi:hypothetical protein